MGHFGDVNCLLVSNKPTTYSQFARLDWLEI